ncbi:MAG: terminase [Phycisphaeraceae bacterium]|nr:terminase [Phycisphaeraceae bacterium]
MEAKADLDIAITEGNRPYEPRGAALALFSCREREVLMEGPAGTGKTRALLEKANLCAIKYPGMRALLVRKTRESMTQSVLVTFEEKVVPPDWPILAGASRAQRQCYTYPNGSCLVIGGIDRSSKIMSTEFDLVLAFEARELTEDDWECLLTRLRHGAMPYQQAVADTNPDLPNHWLNRRAGGTRMIRLLSRHEDNPTIHADYLANLSQLTGVRRQRLYKGQWAGVEGRVYADFDSAVHLLDKRDIPPDWRRVRSIDFGFTHPLVCQWWAVDGDGRMYLYRELYRTRMLVEDAAKRIVALSEGERIEATVADHDAEGRATLERYNVATLPADKRIHIGIQAVSSRLRLADDGKPRLFLLRDVLVERDPRLSQCHEPACTQEEIDHYVWPRELSGSSRNSEAPAPGCDHGMDAMRYAVSYVDGLNHADAMLDIRVLGVRE